MDSLQTLNFVIESPKKLGSIKTGQTEANNKFLPRGLH